MKTITFRTPTLTPGRPRAFVRLWPLLALMLLFPDRSPHAAEAKVLTGKAAMGDWTTRRAGRAAETDASTIFPRRTPRSRPGINPKLVKRPEGAWPKAPDGFKVEEFARDLKNPRVIVTAPNGDLFVAESKADRVRVLRDADDDGKPELNEVFADDLKQPFGIAFHPPGPEPKHIYIANTDAVVRLPYRNGQTKAEGEPEKLVELSGGGQLTGGGHWTRDIVFSRDGKKLFVSVGSKSNVE